jgi:hypothetical protein
MVLSSDYCRKFEDKYYISFSKLSKYGKVNFNDISFSNISKPEKMNFNVTSKEDLDLAGSRGIISNTRVGNKSHFKFIGEGTKHKVEIQWDKAL